MIYGAKPRNDVEKAPCAVPSRPAPAAPPQVKAPVPAANHHPSRTPSFTSQDISSPHLHSSTNRKLNQLPHVSTKQTPSRPAPPAPTATKKAAPPRPATSPIRPPSSHTDPQYANTPLDNVYVDNTPVYYNTSDTQPNVPPPRSAPTAKKPVPAPKKLSSSQQVSQPSGVSSRMESLQKKFSQPSQSVTKPPPPAAKPRLSFRGQRPDISAPIPLDATRKDAVA
jgi:hypothetical protein